LLFPLGPHQVVDVFDLLQIHREAFEAVGDFAEHRLAVQTADLLEVRELGHFHAVQPHFPAEAPRAERGIFPVVFDKAHVVLLQVEAERFERAEVQVEDVFRRRLEHHLILVVMLQTVRILAITTVFRTTRRLHIGGTPRLGADGAQERMNVGRARADFHVDRLEQRATLLVPVGLQCQDDLLKREHEVPFGHGADPRSAEARGMAVERSAKP
jgi:hypothetical protein